MYNTVKGKQLLPRGNEKALIATLLYWDEVIDSLSSDKFTITVVIRKNKNGRDSV